MTHVTEPRACVSFFKLKSCLFEELLIKLTKFHDSPFKEQQLELNVSGKQNSAFLKKCTFCALLLKRLKEWDDHL